MKKEKGFTLAEVLVTLAIIGVVASLTISSIVVKVNDEKIKTAKDVFETKILDVAGLMYVRGELYGTTSENFISKLGNYMKLTKTCTSDNLSDCFPSTIVDEENDKTYDVNSLKTPKSIGLSYSNDNNVGGVMADGTKFILSFDPNCSITTYSTAVASCMHMVADLPISSSKNIVGKDIYLYNTKLNNDVIIDDLIKIGCYTQWTGDALCVGVPESTVESLGLEVEDSDDWNYIVCECEGGNCEESKAKVTSCYKQRGAPEPS